MIERAEAVSVLNKQVSHIVAVQQKVLFSTTGFWFLVPFCEIGSLMINQYAKAGPMMHFVRQPSSFVL